MAREPEEETIRELLRRHPKGLTIEEVSKKLALSRTTAAKYLNAFVLTGQADMRTLGSAKLFSLTQRVPLTNLLSLSSDMILILDDDLFIQQANEAFLGYFSQEKEAIRGTQLPHSPLVPHFLPAMMAAVGRALEGEGSAQEVRFDLIADNRFFRMKCIPLTFENGSRAAGVIFEDITEMKDYQRHLEEEVRERTDELLRAAELLRESQRTLATLMGNLPGMAYRYRNEPGQPLEFVSEGCLELTGYEPGELIGSTTHSFTSLIHPDDLQGIRDKTDEAIRERRTFQHIYRIQCRDGSVKWVWEQGLGIFTAGGELVAIEGFITDVTDRKNAEEIIRKANKQAALLTGITRHDIINQINTLNAEIEIRMMEKPNGSEEEFIRKVRAFTGTILRQIIFTRDYQNVGAEPPRWIPVRQKIDEILQTFERDGIAISVETGELEIYADPLIEKVFFNLIDNSKRHGGHVSRIRFSCIHDGPDLCLVYEDDGTGIPDEEKELIFERGFGKNTGYGLFLIREILSITGFSVRETGTPGKGARFVIRVPARSFRFV